MKAESGIDRWIPGAPKERLLLLLLLMTALLLRAWPGMAYVHDELSALVRLYPTLGETVEKGVIGVDTHPPGVQVFLWAWTRLVGLDEWAVKLPFVLASLGALLFLYRIAARLAGTSAALVLAAVLATIQYTVLYGQLARPYAFGLLSTAWMADALLRYRDQGRPTALVEIAIAAALSGWIHHIALLQALVIGLSGLWLVPATLRRNYLLAAGAAALMYAPNAPLLLRQFAWKGLDEWLPAPTLGWFMDHARFVTHWSLAFGLVLGTLIIWSAVRSVRATERTTGLLTAGLCWGLLPYLIVFGYSVLRSPVLQHSVVLFAFPYLLLLLLAGLSGLSFPQVATTASVLVLVSLATLMGTRHHFALTDHAHSRYEVIARGIVDANDRGHVAVTDAPEHIIRFYQDRWNIPPAQREHLDLTGLDAMAVANLLRALSNDLVFLGTTLQAPSERRAQVQQFFPFLMARMDMAEGQAFVFSARPRRPALDDATFRSTCSPQAVEGSGWRIDPAVGTVQDTGAFGRLQRWSMAGREFGLEFHGGTLGASSNDVIEAQATAQGSHANLLMVVELKRNEERVAYRTGPFNGTDAHLAVAPLDDVPVPLADLGVTAYVWNREQAPATISSVALLVRKGNPVQYGLLGPVKGPWTYR